MVDLKFSNVNSRSMQTALGISDERMEYLTNSVTEAMEAVPEDEAMDVYGSPVMLNQIAKVCNTYEELIFVWAAHYAAHIMAMREMHQTSGRSDGFFKLGKN